MKMKNINLGRIGGLFVGLVTGLVLAGAMATSGCSGRAHLTASYGRANNEAFSQQAVPPEAQPKKKNGAKNGGDPTEGLDSTEASAIARTYRRSLSHEGGGGDSSGQMVILNPNAAAQPGGYMPPPSVPDQR